MHMHMHACSKGLQSTTGIPGTNVHVLSTSVYPTLPLPVPVQVPSTPNTCTNQLSADRPLLTMLSKSVVLAAIAGSAAAFTPSVHMSVERRDLIKGGAAAAAVTPFLGSVKPANAFAVNQNGMAPIITVFDHQ